MTHPRETVVQPTITFPIGDHVNVLRDYKKTGHKKLRIFLYTCLCHRLIDMLIEFSQILVFLTHLKCLNVPYPSIFTNFCMNYYAHVPCGEKNAKNPSAYYNHQKIQLHCQHVLPANLPMCLAQMQLCQMIFFKLHISKITLPYIRL